MVLGVDPTNRFLPTYLALDFIELAPPQRELPPSCEGSHYMTATDAVPVVVDIDGRTSGRVGHSESSMEYLVMGLYQ